MLDLMTKRRARVLLRLSAEELQFDRQFQAALHLYMGRVDLWYRELHDISEEAIRADKASHLDQISRVDPDFFSKIAIEWRDGKGINLRKDGASMGHGVTASISGDESHLYFFDMGSPIKWQTWLREEDCIPVAIKAIGTHEAKLTKPLKRCGVRNGDPEEVLNMHTGEWQPTGFVMNWL